MDSVPGDELAAVPALQEARAHVDEGQRELPGQLGNLVGVHLLIAVNPVHIPQPVENLRRVAAQAANEVEIPLGIQGRQGHEHRLNALFLERLGHLGHRAQKLLQWRVGRVHRLGRLGNLRPVEVTVVAAELDDGKVALHAALQILLKYRLPLVHRVAKMGAVHRLHPGGLLQFRQERLGQGLIVVVLIHHHALHQGISVDLHLHRGTSYDLVFNTR